MAGIIALSFPEPDIAVLTLDDPRKGANVLSRSVLDEFAAHLDTLEQRTDLAGLVVRSGKPGSFIAGADLREFAASFDVPKQAVVELCRHGQLLFARLSARDGKQRYLAFMPRMWGHLARTLAHQGLEDARAFVSDVAHPYLEQAA